MSSASLPGVKMNNFRLLGNIEAKFDIPPSLWKKETWRREAGGSAHRDTETIFLKMCLSRTPWAIFNDLNAYWIDEPTLYPQVAGAIVQIVYKLVSFFECGRVMLVKLRVGGQISPHIDQGAYAEHYDRMHYVVSGECDFTCGDETVHMIPGEAWWFNHRLMHSVVNNGTEDRVHLIIDYRRAA